MQTTANDACFFSISDFCCYTLQAAYPPQDKFGNCYNGREFELQPGFALVTPADFEGQFFDFPDSVLERLEAFQSDTEPDLIGFGALPSYFLEWVPDNALIEFDSVVLGNEKAGTSNWQRFDIPNRNFPSCLIWWIVFIALFKSKKKGDIALLYI